MNKNVVTRTDMTAYMKESYGISLKEAKANINMVFDTILEFLKKEDVDAVQIVGFGSFEKHLINARKGRDFRTGNEITIPEHTRIAFKRGNKLKEACK